MRFTTLARTRALSISAATLLALSLVWPLGAAAQQAEEMVTGRVKEEMKEPSPWSGSANLGLAIQQATTDLVTVQADLAAQRQWEQSLVRLGLAGVYGTTDDGDGEETTAGNIIGTAAYRRYFADWVYGFLNGEAGHDAIQNVDIRAIIDAGPGARWWEAGEKQYFDTEFGVGYLHTTFAPVGNDREDTRNDLVLRAGFEHANLLGQFLEFVHRGEFIFPATNTNTWIARTDVIGSVPIGAGWSFNNGIFFQYENKPPEGIDNETFRYTAGLGYKW